MSETLKRRLVLWAWAGATALILCLPELVLIPALRDFYQRRFPQAAASWTLDGRFRAVRAFDDRDENEYAGRAMLAARSFIPRDPHVKENRSLSLALSDTLTFMAMGAMVRLAGGLDAGWILTRFIGCALWVVGLFLILRELSGRPRFSLAVSVAAALFFDVLEVPFLGRTAFLPALKQMLLHSSYYMGHYAWNFGVSRMANPALTFPPFLFAAWLLLRGLRERSGRLFAGAGLLGGALVYVHPDVGLLFLGGTGLYLAADSLRRRRLDWPLAGAWAGALVLSLPWLLTHAGLSHELMARAGSEFVRRFDAYALLWGAAAAWALLRKEDEAPVRLLGCFIALVFLVLESSLLTGHAMSPNHWHRLGGFLTMVLAAGVLGRRGSDPRGLLWLAAVLAVWAAGRAVSYSSLRYPYQALPKDLDEAYAFLERGAPEDSVVASLGPLENMFLPVYTRCRNLVGYGFVIATDLPVKDLLQRQRRAFELLGIKDEEILAALERHGQAESNAAWQSELWQGRVDWLSREWELFGVCDNVSRRDYAAALEGLRGAPPDRSAALDYLWVGPFERSLMRPGAERRLGKPLFQNKTVSIYPVPAGRPS